MTMTETRTRGDPSGTQDVVAKVDSVGREVALRESPITFPSERSHTLSTLANYRQPLNLLKLFRFLWKVLRNDYSVFVPSRSVKAVMTSGVQILSGTDARLSTLASNHVVGPTLCCGPASLVVKALLSAKPVHRPWALLYWCSLSSHSSTHAT
ncbi:hypothetical protein J6590_045636 [Homalodisca vitripennis]|nr:hypothetical protein J6590_045636 [Homalodisca vitripennis]